MTEPVTRLPDCDSIKGMTVLGSIVQIQYAQASDRWFEISMTLPNAIYLLSLLSELPGADQTLEKAHAFRAQRDDG